MKLNTIVAAVVAASTLYFGAANMAHAQAHSADPHGHRVTGGVDLTQAIRTEAARTAAGHWMDQVAGRTIRFRSNLPYGDQFWAYLSVSSDGRSLSWHHNALKWYCLDLRRCHHRTSRHYSVQVLSNLNVRGSNAMHFNVPVQYWSMNPHSGGWYRFNFNGMASSNMLSISPHHQVQNITLSAEQLILASQNGNELYIPAVKPNPHTQ